ncbi:hypothetical protein Taro_032466 [Colocasia esculenta]|uniref:Uncharacterized protein n=1 Tax=Colocasia esculenta TaxID=4460 RepID=A0A843W666_COLES|nr:hypothetical protein [Colocasia esculenta]
MHGGGWVDLAVRCRRDGVVCTEVAGWRRPCRWRALVQFCKGQLCVMAGQRRPGHLAQKMAGGAVRLGRGRRCTAAMCVALAEDLLRWPAQLCRACAEELKRRHPDIYKKTPMSSQLRGFSDLHKEWNLEIGLDH